MAELHKFKDDVRGDEGRSAPILADELDKNFAIVNLKISANLAGFLRIKENAPKESELEFVVPPPSGSAVPLFSGGTFSQWIPVKEC
jgi:hypothetical protein